MKKSGAIAKMGIALVSLIPVLALTLAELSNAQPSDQSSVETGVAPPPEGRPPTGPLRRTDSRKWEITLAIDLPAFHKGDDVAEALIVPVSILDTWWQVDPRSFRARVSADMVPVPDALTSLTVSQGRRGDSRAEVSLPPVVEDRLRAEVSWVVESWSCQLDEDVAAALKWPTSWPDEVERWRHASPGLDPAGPNIQALKRQVMTVISNDTPPLYVAKEIIRTASRSLRSGNHQEGNPFGLRSRGIELWGVSQALSREVGSEADVACICVALLRSMGFPARPVIGLVDRKARPGAGSSTKELGMWGEVYLPKCGWIPFDPDRIRGGISAGSKLNQPWKGFGSDSDLNERVPISHELDIRTPSGSDAGRTASFATLCRLKAKLDQPGQGPTDILIQTMLVSRGRGRGGS